MVDEKTIARFWSKVAIASENECWLWNGRVVDGTGRLSTLAKHGLSSLSHFAAYQLTYGNIPEKHNIEQVCNNALCCNPSHLTLVPVPTIDERFDAKVNKTSTCWFWQGCVDKDGYGIFTLAHHREIKAHRYSFERVKGKIPARLLCLHLCDRPGCVNPDHLFLGTPTDNMIDMLNKERHKGGKHNPGAKLTERDIIEIRVLDKWNIPVKDIARGYDVTHDTIRKIVSRRIWKDI